MAAATIRLPAILQQKPGVKDFSKIREHKKDLSHWSRQEVPCLKLVSHLDTDHWAKLKGKHIAFVQSIARDVQPAHLKHTHPMNTPGLSSAFHKYDHRKQRKELLKKSYTMYYHGKPVEDKTSPQEANAQRPQAQRRPSVYNQRAKGGFKFWLERDPMVTKIPLCSKYTFGSKGTFHGLGNAPRN